MKTKNIFLTAISALFIFAACTEEKIIDEPGVSGKGDLVIELSPSSVITKAAATNEGYVYATEEELNVEDCWIFVFGENEKYITEVSNIVDFQKIYYVSVFFWRCFIGN